MKDKIWGLTNGTIGQDYKRKRAFVKGQDGQDQPRPRIVELLQTHSDAYLRHTPRGCAGPLDEG